MLMKLLLNLYEMHKLVINEMKQLCNLILVSKWNSNGEMGEIEFGLHFIF